MANGQGITWGGMIKGAVKITAIVAVGIGIIAGFGLGADALFSGAANPTLSTIGGFGASVVSSVTGATEYIANAVAAPIGGIIDWVTGANADQAALGGTGVGEAVTAGEGVAISPEALTSLSESTAASAAAMIGEGGSITQTITSINDAITAITTANPEANVSELRGLLAQAEAVQTAATALSTATPDTVLTATNNLLEATKTFAGNEGLLKILEGEITTSMNAIDITNVDARAPLQAQLDAINAIRDTGSNAISDVIDIRGEVATVHNPITLPNAPAAWATVGAGGVALGAAHRLGRSQGQREVVGAFTKAEMERRASAAQAVGAAQGA